MRKKVLILAQAGDFHAESVAAVLERERLAQPVLLDPQTLATQGGLTLRFGNGQNRVAFRQDEVHAAGEELAGVWLRRIPSVQLDMLQPSDRRFAAYEWRQSLEGALDQAPCRLVNDPWAETRAGRKAIQLATALHCGLPVPQTLITNEAEKVRDFYEKHSDGVVVKVFRSPEKHLVETRVLRQEDLANLEFLHLTPAIFQEYLAGASDVRVTVVDRQIFAARLTPRREMVDYRLDPLADIEPFDIGHDVQKSMLALMSDLGLSYCSADFRLTPEGELVFLDLNPGGQFLFVEIRAGHPISRAIALLLAGEQQD
ncbi:MAG: ATP-grasp domain-containing protein [Egibacteraceae bacterium]